jgi:hypothetical protein
MATLNNKTVTSRHNRPSTVGSTYLEIFYVKNGKMDDPYGVCSVHIFKDTDNGNSSIWIDGDSSSPTFGLVPSSLDKDAAFIFIPASGDHRTTSEGFSVDKFKNTNSTASGIYREEEGHFSVVLKGGASGTTWRGRTKDYINEASSTGGYFDIWTVEDENGGGLRTIINSFELFYDTVFATTEPILLTTSFRLLQKYVNKNSVEKLQVKTDHVVHNQNVSEELKNIFRHSVTSNASIRIVKVKDDTSTGLPYTQILDWTDMDISSDDTLSYSWNTSALDVGTYELQVSSSILDRSIFSDKFSLILR